MTDVDVENYNIPVTTWLPKPLHARLRVVAARHEVTVGALIVELLRRTLAAGAPPPVPVRTTGSRSRRADAGKPRRRWSDEDGVQLRTMHAAGLSDGQIAQALGWSTGQIGNKRWDLGLQPNFIGRARTKPALEISEPDHL